MSKEFKRATVQCDECKTQFILEDSCLGTGISLGLSVEYFSCPKCGYRYPYMLEDKEQRELNKMLQQLQKNVDYLNSIDKPVSKSRIRQLSTLLDESKAHQAMLRNKYYQAVTDQLNKVGEETNS